MKKTGFMFIKYNLLNLRRQWYTLPLLFVFPALLLASVILLVAYFLIPSQASPIEIGIVDLAESEETEFVLELLKESPLLGQAIKLEPLEEKEAQARIARNQLGAYIVFPKDFIDGLYEGEQATVQVIGNPKRSTESELTKGLVDSMMRHINVSQRHIIMLNNQAKTLGMDEDKRRDYLLDQFMSFAMFIGAKDKLIREKDLTAYSQTKPFTYYTLALWFVLTLSWLFSIYVYLTDSISDKMRERIALYGVTEARQISARISVSLLLVLPLSSGVFLIYQKINELVLLGEDYLNLFGVLCLVSLGFLVILAVLDSLFRSYLRPLMQASLFSLLLVLSGALVPIIYLPLSIQKLAEFNPLFNGFYWLQEVILNERFFVDYTFLIISSVLLFSLLGCILIVKERVKQ